MKLNKKIAMAVVAITMCATSTMAMSACGGGNPQTPKDPEYGAWQITKLPTAYATGTATRTKTDSNGTSSVDVVLPVLTKDGTGYASSERNNETKKYSYTFAHDTGDITFETYAAFTVAEAVEVSTVTSSAVISGGGDVHIAGWAYERDTESEDEEEIPTKIVPTDTAAEISYEFGNNYVHINDGVRNQEVWYTKNSDNSYFTVLKDHDALGNDRYAPSNLDDIAETFDGYSFRIEYLMDYSEYYYGLDSFLEYLYSEGKSSGASDFTESVSAEGEYSFSYNVAVTKDQNLPVPDENDQIRKFQTCTFFVISVSFGLDDNFVPTNFELQHTHYESHTFNTGTNEYDDDGIVKNTDGKWSLVAGKENEYKKKTTYSLAQKSELEEGESAPSNPFAPQDFLVSSFDLEIIDFEYEYDQFGDFVSEKIIDIGAVTGTLEMTAGTPVRIQVRNVKPTTANFNFDNLKIYLRTADGDVELKNMYATTDGNIAANFENVYNSVLLNCHVAGDFKVVLKTSNYEKVIDIHVPFMAPTGFASSVYVENELTDSYNWDKVNDSFTVYEGQPLNFTAVVDHPAYQESGYSVTVTNAAGTEVDSSWLTDSMVEGVPAHKLTAAQAGVYTVTLTSTYGTGMTTATFTVTVEEAPALADLLSGKYVNKDAELTVEFSNDGQLQATVELSDLTTVLNVSYGDDGVTLAYASGADDNTYSLEVSAAYNLYLVVDKGFGTPQKLLLTQDGFNALLGTYALAWSKANAQSHTVTVAGTYRLSSDSYGSYVFYCTGDPDSASNVAVNEPVEVVLHEGDLITVWSLMNSNNGTYTFEYVSSDVDDGEGDGEDEGEEFTQLTLGDSDEFELEIYEKIVFSFEGEANTRYTFTVNGLSMYEFMIREYVNGQEQGAGYYDTYTVAADADGKIYFCFTAQKYGVTSKFSINVSEAVKVSGVTLPESQTFYIGDVINLTPVVTPDNAADKSGTWTSDNPDVVLVSTSYGYTTVKAVGEGTATLTFTTADGGFSADCEVTVAVRTISDGDEITLGQYSYSYFNFTGTPETAYTFTVTGSNNGYCTIYKSENYQYDWSVSGSGMLTLTTDANGKLQLCLNSGGGTFTVEIGEPTPVSGVTVEETYECSFGDVIYLTPVVSPSNAADKSGTWSSDNPDVVKIVSNYGYTSIKAVGAGTANLTFTTTDGGFAATCAVTVSIETLSDGDEIDVERYETLFFEFTGAANTSYQFSVTATDMTAYDYKEQDYVATEDYTLFAVENGSESYSKNSDNKPLVLTTDANGKVYIGVMGSGNGTVTMSVEVYNSDNEEEEEGEEEEGVTVITQSGTYGSDDDASYGNPLIYKLVVGANEVYSVAESTNAFLVVGSYKDGDVDEDDSLDLKNLTQGTYYIALYAYNEGTTNAWFTVSVTVNTKLGLGNNTVKLTADNAYDGVEYIFTSKTGGTYTISYNGSDSNVVVGLDDNFNHSAIDVQDDKISYSFKLSAGESITFWCSYNESVNVEYVLNISEGGYVAEPVEVTESGTYGSDTDADYNNALVYKVVVAEGQTCAIDEGENAYIIVGTVFEGGEVESDYRLNLLSLSAGTYYVALYAYERGTTNAWFTVTFSDAE